MPRTARPKTVHPLALRELEVVRVTDVTPGMRRVTLSGPQLDAHTGRDGEGTETSTREFISTGFDDDVRLIFPYPGRTEPVLPVMRDGGLHFPRDPRPLSRAYTVRRWDEQARELDLDFVKHGVGVATTWAYRAAPGDRVHVVGPPASLGLPTGIDAWVVAGDETALPAIGHLLEDLPDDATAQVFVQIADDAHRQELAGGPGVEVTWLVGEEPDLLTEAVRGATWPEGRVFAWLAGEQAVVRDLRRHLVEDRGVAKSDIDFSGYWKREEVVALDEDPQVPDPERNERAFERFHEQAELLPPLAIRAAADLGIAEAISRGVRDVPALAEATGTDARALGKFLRYLQTLELLVPAGEGYDLSPTGEFLTNEYVLDVIRHDGIEARKQLGFHGLEHALRTGGPAYEQVTGTDYAALRADPEFENALLDDVAEYASYLTQPLAGLALWGEVGRVVVHADGAGAVAASLVEAQPNLRVTLAALPTAAAWLRADLPTTIPDAAARERVDVAEQSIFDATPGADAILFVHVLDTHPDADAALILRRAAESLAPGGRILLVESTFDTDELDEHDAEDDLLKLTLHGSGLRTPAELDALVDQAGLTPVATEHVGWGHTVRVFSAGGS